MKDDIKVSVVTVCYNSGSSLERTIESVARQTYSNVEYIIIDGASTDNTLQIIKKHEDSISYWMSEPDYGIYNAMNKGTKFATGELIAFLNSDDWYMDETVEVVVDAYRRSKAAVLFGDCFFVDETGKYIPRYYDNTNLSDFCYCMPISHPSTFVETHLQKEYGFDENYKVASDYKFLSYLYYTGRKFYHISQILSFFSYGGFSTKKYIYRSAREARDVAENNLKNNKSIGNEIEVRQKINGYYNSMIRNLIFMRMEKYHFYFNWMCNKFSGFSSILIFGAGNTGKQCFLQLKSFGFSVQAFLDNCSQLHHSFIFNIEILPPEVLLDMRDVCLLVASEKYEAEIYHQLKSMQLHRSIYLILYTRLLEEALKKYLKHFVVSDATKEVGERK